MLRSTGPPTFATSNRPLQAVEYGIALSDLLRRSGRHRTPAWSDHGLLHGISTGVWNHDLASWLELPPRWFDRALAFVGLSDTTINHSMEYPGKWALVPRPLRLIVTALSADHGYVGTAAISTYIVVTYIVVLPRLSSPIPCPGAHDGAGREQQQPSPTMFP